MAQLDLADMNSIHQLVKQLDSEPALDFIFLNAGVMACPQSYTKNGFEMQVGTNHFGHFELTSSLMDKLKTQVCPELMICSTFNSARNTKIWLWWRYQVCLKCMLGCIDCCTAVSKVHATACPNVVPRHGLQP